MSAFSQFKATDVLVLGAPSKLMGAIGDELVWFNSDLLLEPGKLLIIGTAKLIQLGSWSDRVDTWNSYIWGDKPTNIDIKRICEQIDGKFRNLILLKSSFENINENFNEHTCY